MPTITWPTPSSIAYGTALGEAQLNAVANAPGVFAYSPAAGAILPAGAGQILHAMFTPADANNYENAAGETAITVTKATVALTLGNLSHAYDGTAKSASITTSPAGLSVTLTYNAATSAPIYPGAYSVVATMDDSNYQGTVSGTLVVTITALVRHAPVLNGEVDGSVQLLLPESSTLNSQALLSGDLLVPGAPTVHLNGQPTYGSTLDAMGSPTPANFSITLNSGSVLRHVVRRIDPIALSTVAAPPPPAGTRTVSLNSPAQPTGDFATLRHLTLNSNVGPVAVPPGTYGNFVANSGSGFILGVVDATEPAIYHLQSLTLNGASTLQVAGPVILTLASGVTINGTAGSSANPGWLTLQLSSGGLTLNSGAALHGSVTAPAGTVTINGNSAIHGRAACDRLTINSGGLLSDLDF